MGGGTGGDGGTGPPQTFQRLTLGIHMGGAWKERNRLQMVLVPMGVESGGRVPRSRKISGGRPPRNDM